MRFLILAVLILIPVLLSAQKKKTQPKAPVEDIRAMDLIQQGKKALLAEDYEWAAIQFKQALKRPRHVATSVAIYLLGLTHFFMEEEFEAHMQFDSLIHNFESSRYVEDAKYHKALMFLDEGQDFQRYRAVKLLNWVADSAQSFSLRKDARNALRSFAFSADQDFLEKYLDLYEADNKQLFVEALCYTYLSRGDRFRAKDIYRNWKRSGGSDSNYLIRLFDNRRKNRRKNRDHFKVAVFLPLHLTETDSLEFLEEIPNRSKLALEFYEGLQLAIDNRDDLKRSYTFKVFDTSKDSQKVEDLWWDLDDFYPDLVLGSIFNKQSEVVSRWAEQTGTPQIVPLSPSDRLVEDKSFVFLATPEVKMHGVQMAKYARDSLGLQKVVVWTIPNRNTELMAQAFSEVFQRMGGTVIPMALGSDYEETKEKIPELVKSLKFQGIDGAYIPILNDEETSALILSRFRSLNFDIKVMGGPHWWKRYSTIDEDLKFSFELVFSSSFFTEKHDPLYQAFSLDYSEKYALPPGEFSVQGYDLGLYLLHVLDNYYPPAMNLETYLRNHPPFRGLHLTYDFTQGQSNSFLNIGAYKDGRVIKVNDRKPFFNIQGYEDR